MATATRRSLDEYLALNYPFNVIADPAGSYVILFPDLPGCMTQVDRLEDVSPMAEEIRTLWIETEFERDAEIPLPTYPEEYSGKFNVRLPRSLHRRLAAAARQEQVSLNQYVLMLLSGGGADQQSVVGLVEMRAQQDRIEAALEELGARVGEIQTHMSSYRFSRMPQIQREAAR